MNTKHHFDYWKDRHAIHMEPEEMDKFSLEESLFSGETSRKQQVIADALDTLPNQRYRHLLIGLYHRHLSPKLLAEEMEVTLPNFYNLHRRALAALRTHYLNIETTCK